jgi:hypothetical protein
VFIPKDNAWSNEAVPEKGKPVHEAKPPLAQCSKCGSKAISDRVNRMHTNADAQPAVRISCSAACGNQLELTLPEVGHWRDESAWARLELRAISKWNTANVNAISE